jgi:hypothetical protein
MEEAPGSPQPQRRVPEGTSTQRANFISLGENLSKRYEKVAMDG